jgi:UPF0271 protein
MVKEKTVTSVNKKTVPIIAETICIHSDGTHPVEFAQRIRQILTDNNISIKAM